MKAPDRHTRHKSIYTVYAILLCGVYPVYVCIHCIYSYYIRFFARANIERAKVVCRVPLKKYDPKKTHKKK